MLRSVVKFGRCYKDFCKYNVNSRKSFQSCISKNFKITTVFASNYGARSFLKDFCDNRWSDGNKRKQKAHKEKSPLQAKHDWLDALGWSGVLLLGWYLCQPYCHRISRNPAERYAFQQLSQCSATDYSSIIHCLTKVINLESTARYVIPSVIASKTSTFHDDSQNSDEVIKEVCNKLEEAHAKVNSSLQNFLGTECMQLGKHDEAFVHFLEAAKSSHSSALFNLGICYEMGLGTKQSFTKAAEFYQKAADLGHATAMYNLGVFYVHGWGGKSCNEKEAERLFTTASDLGQKDARRALNLEIIKEVDSKDMVSDLESNSGHLKSGSILNSIELQNNTLTDIWFKVMNIKLDLSKTDDIDEKTSSDSGINELSPNADLGFFQK